MQLVKVLPLVVLPLLIIFKERSHEKDIAQCLKEKNIKKLNRSAFECQTAQFKGVVVIP